MASDRKPPTFFLGDRQGAHLMLRPLHREQAAEGGDYDENWLSTDVRLKAGGFAGAFRATLRVEELESFRAQLAELYDRLVGTAALDSTETWLHLRIEGDGRGGLVARGEATDDPAVGNRLAFVLFLDQSYLPEALQGLDAILAANPRVGV